MHSCVHYHLNTVHVGAKEPNKNPSWRVVNDVFKALLNGAFRWSAAQTFGGGTFAKERQDAFITKLRKALKIRTFVVKRGWVKTEVTGVNNPANWGVEHHNG